MLQRSPTTRYKRSVYAFLITPAYRYKIDAHQHHSKETYDQRVRRRSAWQRRADPNHRRRRHGARRPTGPCSNGIIAHGYPAHGFAIARPSLLCRARFNATQKRSRVPVDSSDNRHTRSARDRCSSETLRLWSRCVADDIARRRGGAGTLSPARLRWHTRR